jgi:hypothetical protein
MDSAGGFCFTTISTDKKEKPLSHGGTEEREKKQVFLKSLWLGGSVVKIVKPKEKPLSHEDTEEK